MSLTTEKRPFVADAVFIPAHATSRDRHGEHVDPSACIKLMVAGDNNTADVYSEETWTNGGEPYCRRERGEFTAVEGGRVELLPELCIVKIDERGHWIDPDVLAACPRIYGVYVFDKRRHVHVCSVESCYELHFLGSDYTCIDEVMDDDDRSEAINEKIMDGDAMCEPVSYWSTHDVDRFLETEIDECHLPPADENGGYRLTGIESVSYDDAIEEAREWHNRSPL